MTLRHTIEIRKSMRQMVSRDKTLSSSRISQFRIRLSRFAPLKATKKPKSWSFAQVHTTISVDTTVCRFWHVSCTTRLENQAPGT